MTISDSVVMGDYNYEVTWLPAPFVPERGLVSQCGGVCFADDGRVVVVTSDGETWTLPAGHPEEGETLEEALVREVAEEACARVTACEYIGCHEVVGPSDDPNWTSPVHYSAKFWARVELLPFEPEHETKGRRLVRADDLLAAFNWRNVRSAQAMVDAAVACEMSSGERDDPRQRPGVPEVRRGDG